MLAEMVPAGVAPAGVDEAKAYLRLDGSAEDAVLAGLLRAATNMAEAFTGQWLIARGFEEGVRAIGGWQRLGVRPVTAITGVTLAAYEVDIDRHGAGWVRILNGDATLRVNVTGTAGLAADWNGVPEGVRAGIVRLAAQMFTQRDSDAGGLPMAVTALWRPWRVL